MMNKRHRVRVVAGVLSALCMVALVGLFVKVPLSFTGSDSAFDAPSGPVPQRVPAPMSPEALASTTEDAPVEGEVASVPGSVRGPVASADGSVVIGREHVPGVVIAHVSAEVDPVALSTALAGLPCLDAASAAIAEADLAAGFVALPVADGYNVADAIAALEDAGPALDPQPNYLYHLVDEVSADALIGGQMLDTLADVNDPQGKRSASAAYNWYLESIRAYDAWDIVKGQDREGNERVTVAVLDTGYDVDHEDLTEGGRDGIGGNVIASYDATSEGASPQNSKVEDIVGHGTHVAGIIGAIANNETGVAGVSYNANLLPIQVFYKYTDEDGATKYGASSIGIRYAYQYIVEHADQYNIKIANMSLGASASALESADTLVLDAVEEAYEKGVLTICAAGNDAANGAYTDFPCDYLKHGMGVIALDQDPLQRGSYSNYNTSSILTTKDISAPGTAIYSTTCDGAYGQKTGTSMASPIVAGVAALVFSANPSLGPSDVIDVLHATAKDLVYTNGSEEAKEGFDQFTGYGEVDALAAVESAVIYLSGDSTLLVDGSMELALNVPPPTGEWEWSSDDATVASVAEGVVTGVSGGTAVITASSGTVSASKTVTVYDISFSVDGMSDEAVGEIEVEAGETVNLQFNESPDTGLWYIGTQDPLVARSDVSSDGLVPILGVSAGKTRLQASLKENPGLVVSVEVSVHSSTSKYSLESSRAAVYWTQGDYESGRASGKPDDVSFSGFSAKPVPYKVTYEKGNGLARRAVDLTLGEDYEVVYENNEEAGHATATVKGVGDYEGAVKGAFSIRRASLKRVTALWSSPIAYTGEPLTPVPDLSLTSANGTYRLVEGKDFEITSYDDNVYASANVEAGHAVAHMRGIGNFSGTDALDFVVGKASLKDDAVFAAGWVYDGAARSPEVVVAHDGKQLDQAGNWTVVVSKDGGTISVPTVFGAGDYAVEVTGAGNYEGSASTTFTVSPRPIEGAEVELDESSFAYDGNPRRPSVESVVLAGGTPLGLGDYTVSYPAGGAIDAGAYMVDVIGIGNYAGAVSTAFSIEPATLADAKVGAEGWAYDGKAHELAVTVTYGDELLPSEGNWTYAVAGNEAPVSTASILDAGRYEVAVEGEGNYTGSAMGAFTVSPAIISSVTPSAERLVYDGTPKRPDLAVNSGILTLSANDFTSEYSNNVSAGIATVRVTGKGNAFGQAEATFVIAPARVGSIALSRYAYVYDGSEKCPEATVRGDDGRVLEEKVDYTLEYSDNTDVGTATVVAKGRGNYAGELKAEFEIQAVPDPGSSAQGPDPDSLSASKSDLPAAPGASQRASRTSPPSGTSGSGSAGNAEAEAAKASFNTANPGSPTSGSASAAPSAREPEPGLAGSTGLGQVSSDDAGQGTGNSADSAVVHIAEQVMQRLYNPYTGEHFYTTDIAERDDLATVGWSFEGAAWDAPEVSETPVRRLYNPYSGDHHYTTDVAERDFLVPVGWIDEGIGWYSDDAHGVELHRLYNPYAETGAHHYTTDAAERDYLASAGWVYEGTAWYGLA